MKHHPKSKRTKKFTCWWFQPIWKNSSQNGNLPQTGEESKKTNWVATTKKVIFWGDRTQKILVINQKTYLFVGVDSPTLWGFPNSSALRWNICNKSLDATSMDSREGVLRNTVDGWKQSGVHQLRLIGGGLSHYLPRSYYIQPVVSRISEPSTVWWIHLEDELIEQNMTNSRPEHVYHVFLGYNMIGNELPLKCESV